MDTNLLAEAINPDPGFHLTAAMVVGIATAATTAIGVIFRLFLSSQERLIGIFNDRATAAENRTIATAKDFSDERKEYKLQQIEDQRKYIESIRGFEMQSRAHTSAIEELTQEIKDRRLSGKAAH